MAESGQTMVLPNELQHSWWQQVEIAWPLFPQHTFQQLRLAEATCLFPVNQIFPVYF